MIAGMENNDLRTGISWEEPHLFMELMLSAGDLSSKSMTRLKKVRNLAHVSDPGVSRNNVLRPQAKRQTSFNA